MIDHIVMAIFPIAFVTVCVTTVGLVLILASIGIMHICDKRS